jgi:hypothetical protein
MPLEPPYVSAALFCDKVVEGKDNTLTVVRIIDKVEMQVVADDKTLEALAKVADGIVPKPALSVTGVFGIKSGNLEGKFTVHVEVENPVGKRSRIQSFPVELRGGDSGANFVVNMVLSPEFDGTHWFELIFEERVLSRIPLTISRMRPSTAEPTPSA